MGSTGIVTLSFLLATVLLMISSEVIAARELAAIPKFPKIPKTFKPAEELGKINGAKVKYPDAEHRPLSYIPLNPKRPFCNERIYSKCVPTAPKRSPRFRNKQYPPPPPAYPPPPPADLHRR